MKPEALPRLHGSDDRIRKRLQGMAVQPHLLDWDAACRDFSWDQARQAMHGLPGGALNLGYEAVDRHADSPYGERVAIRWLGADGRSLRLSYRDLRDRSNRFANVLVDAGLQRGDRLFILAPRLPELYVAVIGALKAGLVVAPLYSAFGPEPVATRVQLGAGRAMLTTPSLYRRKVAPVRAQMPSLERVFLIEEAGEGGADADGGWPEATQALGPLMSAASTQFQTVLTRPDDLALLHFTSGTTGRPKGAMHVHEAALTHWMTGRHALDLHQGDVFWCTADPGWVTGMSYGILAPLLHGVTMVVDEAEFDAARWYDILEQQGVTVWYTAPTAIRMLMKVGPELLTRHRFPRLRFVASVGEPLNPQAVWWGQEQLGLPIHDNWWQTETGGIMIANTPSLDIKPGSMGKPLPGVQALVLGRLPDGGVEVISSPQADGELALRSGWPSMFRGYLGEDQRYRKCFASTAQGEIYLTGDLVKRDAEGYYWFVGRADDVIKSAGHLIGPFEVESTLMEHPAVAEAAVIGKPDPVVGETVKAFVTLKPGFDASDTLRRALLAHARTRLGPAVAPKELDFASQLPHTRSGKIMRRLVKAQELGLPTGDTSTLESSS